MHTEQENSGYSFEANETFEWGDRHKIQSLRESLLLLKEECIYELGKRTHLKDLLSMTANVLDALEKSLRRDLQDEGETISPKSDEPWD